VHVKAPIEIAKPWIDGVCYADLFLIKDPKVQAMLIARELVWETHFTFDGRDFVGNVIAGTPGEAAEIADARGLDEQVVGRWQEVETPVE
jgi:hypothetical protein